MSALSDYLMQHHLDAISANDDVNAAALQVIQAQDAKLVELQSVIDALRDFGKLMRFPPAPPARE